MHVAEGSPVLRMQGGVALAEAISARRGGGALEPGRRVDHVIVAYARLGEMAIRTPQRVGRLTGEPVTREPAHRPTVLRRLEFEGDVR